MFANIYKLRLSNNLRRFNFNILSRSSQTISTSLKNTIFPDFKRNMASQKKQNRLANEQSSYLLQHSENPVEWYPWGDEAIQKAKTENKLIFLSIGYSTCHWCHVMEHESFEDENISKIMNDNFVNIKVDREERPDIDKLYMTFILLINGSGGWPLSIWLTPDLSPITGGTYFPPNDRWGMPGFSTVLLKIASKWKSDEDKVNLLQTGTSVIEAIRKSVSQSRADGTETEECLSIEDKFLQSIRIYKRNFDKVLGGSMGAPKFPEVSKINFLLHAFIQTQDQEILDLALITLKKISNGGIHDQVFGGFCRYSVDKNWHIPHFEKMLYDQGQLLTVFANAHKITRDPFYLNVADKIFKYICKDLYHEDGGFYSAEDADSYPEAKSTKKVEGAFYAFNFEEIQTIFKENSTSFASGSEIDPFDVYKHHYDIRPQGNVEPASDPHGHLTGKNVLFVSGSIDKTAEKFSLTTKDVEDILESGNKILLEHRSKRPRPHLDSKIICAWNGLALSGISKLATITHAPNHTEYLRVAKKQIEFIRENMFNATVRKLYRARYADETNMLAAKSSTPIFGFLDDYAFLIKGLIDHYTASMDTSSLLFAKDLQEIQDKLFWDDINGAYFYSEANSTNVVVRMKEDHDGAEPCGNSVSASNLILLGSYFENQDFKDRAQRLSNYFSNTSAFGYVLPEMLSALVMENTGLKMLVIVGDDSKELSQLCEIAQNYFVPGLVTICSKLNDESQLTRKSAAQFKMIKGKATAYICHNKRCNLPITEPEVLREEFESKYLFEKL